jgi:hypothetical protein
MHYYTVLYASCVTKFGETAEFNRARNHVAANLCNFGQSYPMMETGFLRID